MTVLIAGAMIVQDGAVLLGRRALHKRICPGLWDFIGGHVERGETPTSALSRELSEEIGAIPTMAELVGVIDFSPEAGRPTHYHLFRVGGLSDLPRLANAEHTELHWFALGAAARLGSLASGKYRRFLREELARTGVGGAGASSGAGAPA